MSRILIDSLSVEAIACSEFSVDWCSVDVKIKELKICIQHETQDYLQISGKPTLQRKIV